MITAQTKATYEPVDTSVKKARHAAANWLEKQGVQAAVIDIVVLCLSEVVTNAVKVQRSERPVSVRLAMLDDVVRFSVRDDNDAALIRNPVGDDDTCGRGLLILDAVASARGVTPRDRGKFVWCEILLKSGE